MAMTPQQFGMKIAQQTKQASVKNTKKAFMVGGTIGALGGLATSKKNKKGLGVGRGAVIGGGTELGMYPGAALGGLGGMTLGALLGQLARSNGAQPEDAIAGGVLGGAAGALGGGYLGNIGSRALLDDSSHSKRDDEKEEKLSSLMPTNFGTMNPTQQAANSAGQLTNSIAGAVNMFKNPGANPVTHMQQPGGQMLNNVKNVAGSIVAGGIAGQSPYSTIAKNFGRIQGLANDFHNVNSAIKNMPGQPGQLSQMPTTLGMR